MILRALVAIVILLGEFAVLEAGLRIHGGSESGTEFRSLFMQDDRIGSRLKPGARAHYTTSEFSTDIAINAQGVRDDQDIGPKAPNERRVLVLGDSLVLSVQVPAGQTFSERLEAHLNADDGAHHWRVINGGVQGYGPVEDWLFYNAVGAAFQPDIVLVVVFVGNDAIEAADAEGKLEAGRVPDAPGTDQAVTSARRIVRSSLVLQLARVRANQLRARLTTPVPERPLASYLDDPPPEVGHGLEVSRRAFAAIGSRAFRDGTRVAFALMPARFQVEDEDYLRLAAITASAGGTLVRNAATERFEAALAPLGWPTIDLRPGLATASDPKGLFFLENIHLTARGHDVVAGSLASFLEQSGLTR